MSNSPGVSEVNLSDLLFTPLPSASNSLAITTIDVFESKAEITSPTMVGFEVEPCTNTYDNSNEPVSTVATDSDGKRSSHDKEKSNTPAMEAIVIFLSKFILFSSPF